MWINWGKSRANQRKSLTTPLCAGDQLAYVVNEPGASEVRPDQPPEVTPDATLDATPDLPPDSMTATSRAREVTRDRTRDFAPGHPLELTRGFLRVPGFSLCATRDTLLR